MKHSVEILEGTQVSYHIWNNNIEKRDKIAKLNVEICKLKKERDIIINAWLDEIPILPGWKKKVESDADSIGDLLVRAYCEIRRENNPVTQKITLIDKPKEKTKLQKYLTVIDAKTLFNSGILSKEEKKELLDSIE